MENRRKAAREASRAIRTIHRLRAFRESGFTLIEVLAVIAVILILVGIILSTVGYVEAKGAQSRAQAEIQALSNACEAYKGDFGTYPQTSGTGSGAYTSNLSARTNGDPTDGGALGGTTTPFSNPGYYYQNASLYLYTALTGDTNCTGLATVSYFPIKPTMCGRPNTSAAISASNGVQYLMDPWGNSYGYSTAGAQVSSTNAYNPTFDMWSTSGNVTVGAPSSGTVLQWTKNW